MQGIQSMQYHCYGNKQYRDNVYLLCLSVKDNLHDTGGMTCFFASSPMSCVHFALADVPFYP